MKLTENAIRALRIVRANEGIKPKQFARLFFDKKSPGWQKQAKCGPKGTHRGGGMYRCAGSYLGKLYNEGWIRPSFVDRYGWGLSFKGEQVLACVDLPRESQTI